MPTATPAHAPAPAPDEIKHPGFLWLNSAACGELDDAAGPDGQDARSLFFVEAGHVISEETLNVCRGCPVRRECIIHAYLGRDGEPIAAGYMGGFSTGQRKSMTLIQALERAENDPPRPITRRK